MHLAYPTEPSLTLIERPRCRQCQTRMNLARTMPGRKGYDYRTFECTKNDRSMRGPNEICLCWLDPQ
jgi:hypothetical protein